MPSEGRVRIVAGGGMEQCQARHGQYFNLRCVEVHLAIENVRPPEHEHWAVNGKGETVRWLDPVAGYMATGSAREDQVGGEHYKKYKIQPWDIIDEYGLGFYAGNALKYLLRRKADRLQDLKKARHYLDKLIELEEGGRGES